MEAVVAGQPDQHIAPVARESLTVVPTTDELAVGAGRVRGEGARDRDQPAITRAEIDPSAALGPGCGHEVRDDALRSWRNFVARIRLVRHPLVTRTEDQVGVEGFIGGVEQIGAG